ncbi:MAG TPA: hypothetical protein VGC56_16415 [Allosphingosinicella sp.]|jgi:hypothetical protein
MADSDALLAFTPVPLRGRGDGWTPDRQRAFIAAIAGGMASNHAARAVGMSKQTADALRPSRGRKAFRRHATRRRGAPAWRGGNAPPSEPLARSTASGAQSFIAAAWSAFEPATTTASSSVFSARLSPRVGSLRESAVFLLMET